MFKQNVNRSLGGNIMVFMVLALFGAFMALPIVYAVSSAFKPLDEIMIFPPRFFVRRPTVNNFIQLSQIVQNFWMPVSRYIFNSLFVSVAGTLGQLLFASMAAYPLAKHDFVGKKVVNSLIITSLLFTYTVIAIPQYVIMSQLKLVNTYWSLILPVWQSSLGLYLMQKFMGQIPEEMLEAARMDGANEFMVYYRIVMPNVKPAWLTLIILAFQGIWNMDSGTFIYSENLKVIPAILGQITAGGMARAGVGAAAALILMIPPMILFILSQRSVIETMSTSGMK